jgi:hypothetical protein
VTSSMLPVKSFPFFFALKHKCKSILFTCYAIKQTSEKTEGEIKNKISQTCHNTVNVILRLTELLRLKIQNVYVIQNGNKDRKITICQ